MTDRPDIDIEAERMEFEREAAADGWSVDRDHYGKYWSTLTEFMWQGFLARARLAATREWEMQACRDMLIRLSALLDFDSEVDDAGITFADPRAINAAFAEAAQLIEDTKSLKPKGPSDDDPRRA